MSEPIRIHYDPQDTKYCLNDETTHVKCASLDNDGYCTAFDEAENGGAMISLPVDSTTYKYLRCPQCLEKTGRLVYINNIMVSEPTTYSIEMTDDAQEVYSSLKKAYNDFLEKREDLNKEILNGEVFIDGGYEVDNPITISLYEISGSCKKLLKNAVLRMEASIEDFTAADFDKKVEHDRIKA